MKNQTNLILSLSIIIGAIVLGAFYYQGKQSELKAKNVELKIKAVDLQMEQLKSFPKTILIGKDTLFYIPEFSYDLQEVSYFFNPHFYKYKDEKMKDIKTYGED